MAKGNFQARVIADAYKLAPRARSDITGKRYTHRSKPGEYLHMDSGHLRRNILREIDRGIQTARVGTNVLYAKEWELEVPSNKRRKLMRATLLEQQAAMTRIITTGKLI